MRKVSQSNSCSGCMAAWPSESKENQSTAPRAADGSNTPGKLMSVPGMPCLSATSPWPCSA